MTIVGLIRHGVTDWNQAGRMQGQTDIPLNEEGKLQAMKLADRLKQDSTRWDVIYSSDLQRARQTATFIGEALDLLPIHIDGRLRERKFGLAEGLTAEERLARFGANLEISAGIETEDELLERGRQFIEEVVAKHTGKHLLIVSHGGFLKRFFTLLADDIPDVYIENASMTILKQEREGWSVELHNCTTHYK